tara:strand:+ start:593 stop:1729 length:1137 start_codon:yes stop_codon:yes gene_type:complete
MKVGSYKEGDPFQDIDLSNGATLPEASEDKVVEDIVLGGEAPEAEAPDLPADTIDTPPVDEVAPTEEEELPEPKEGSEFIFDEANTFKHLSESLGRKVESFDDLKTNENPLDDDPYLKGLYDWRKKTGRPIEEYSKFQKNFDEVSDLDVAREYLNIKYPNFTKEEITAEMEDFISDDMDMDSEISKKSRQLKKFATEGRGELKKLTAELGNPDQTKYSPEVQQSLDLADKVKKDYESNKQATADYQKQIASVTNSVETMKLALSDDLSIDFKVSADSKKAIPEMISTMPHWKNGDGSWNHQAVVNDAIIIKHHKEMVRLAYEQGKNSGEEQIIRQTSNSTLGQPQPHSSDRSGTKGAEIEGLDEFLGKSKNKLRFKKQ